ncbi:ATP-binding cassette domain-containing protein [Kitasatospora sp. NPDC056138]|uniref:ATP-binding cassette domain-containing protein n=1 Tax=Kitasatospora sp. NPDC056138 TaxID=3345724 RepID=UPI0035E1AC2C
MSAGRAGRGRHVNAGLRLLGEELLASRAALLRVGLWSLVEAAPSLFAGLVVARALDDGFLASRPAVGFGWLAVSALALAAQAAAGRRTYPWLAEVVEPLRDALVRRVAGATLRRAAEGTERIGGDAVARLTGQVESVRQLVSAELRTLRQLVLTVVATVLGLCVLSPLAAALTLVPLAVALGVFALALRSLAARERAVVLADERLSARNAEVLAAVRDVVGCGAQRWAADTVGEAVRAWARARTSLAAAGSVRTVVVALGAQAPVVLLVLASPWLLRDGGLSAGKLVGAITYLGTGLEPALRLLVGSVGSWGLELGVVAGRLAEATAPLPAAPGPAAGSGPGPVRSAKVPELVAERLTFAYGPAAEPVVRDLDLRIPPGDHLAVVGPSGIGKSTLALLLLGLRTPGRGRVLFDGVPLERVGASRLRGETALIPQEAYVFDGTLAENLSYLRPGAPAAELDRSARAVGLGPLVDRLGGYDAVLGADGARLSAGERQLVALARVHLSAAGTVILDEATCHLDPAAEAVAERAFAARGGTLVVIAHRLDSAIRARRVLLLDGTSALLGTHEELLGRSAVYAGLVGAWEPEPLMAGTPRAAAPVPSGETG